MKTIFSQGFLDEIESKGKYLFNLLNKQLRSIECVKEIRGIGLMAGIEVSADVQHILAELRKAGLIVLPAGEKVIRLLPPLNVAYEEITIAVSLLEDTLTRQSIIA